MNSDEIRKKLKFYDTEKIAVFIKLKDSRFYNGEIISIDKPEKDSVVIKDRKTGKVLVLFSEIDYLDPSKTNPDDGYSSGGTYIPREFIGEGV